MLSAGFHCCDSSCCSTKQIVLLRDDILNFRMEDGIPENAAFAQTMWHHPGIGTDCLPDSDRRLDYTVYSMYYTYLQNVHSLAGEVCTNSVLRPGGLKKQHLHYVLQIRM